MHPDLCPNHSLTALPFSFSVIFWLFSLYLLLNAFTMMLKHKRSSCYVEGQNLFDISDNLGPNNVLQQETNRVWVLTANIVVGNSATLNINSTYTSWLKINSTNNHDPYHIDVLGNIQHRFSQNFFMELSLTKLYKKRWLSA